MWTADVIREPVPMDILSVRLVCHWGGVKWVDVVATVPLVHRLIHVSPATVVFPTEGAADVTPMCTCAALTCQNVRVMI